MTNFEKTKKKLIKQIEKMDIEELATFIKYPDWYIECCDYCTGKRDGSRKCLKTQYCEMGIQEYLEREAKK